MSTSASSLRANQLRARLRSLRRQRRWLRRAALLALLILGLGLAALLHHQARLDLPF